MTTKKQKYKHVDLPLGLETGGKWFVPTRLIQVNEETWALRLGRPVQLGTGAQVEKQLGVAKHILARLADMGVINCIYAAPNQRMYYYTEVAEFLKEVENNPGYWDGLKKEAYNTRRRLRDI